MTPEQREKYNDQKWFARLLEIKNLDGHCCQHCPATHLTTPKLTAHHLFYIDNEGPWATPDHGMTTLCDPCHWQEQKLFYYKGNQKKAKEWQNTLTTILLNIFDENAQDEMSKILQKRILYAIDFTLKTNKKLGTRMSKIINEKILKALVPEDQWADFDAYVKQREGGVNLTLNFSSNGNGKGAAHE